MATTIGDYNLPIIEATDKIASATLGEKLMDDINGLATATSAGLVAANPFKRDIVIGENMDDITIPGFYRVLNAATADALLLPFSGAAEVEVKPVGVSVVQELKALAPLSENWQREKYANGVTWGAYRRTDFHKDGLNPATPAGYKLTAQSFTSGFGGSTTTGSGFTRYLQTLTPHARWGRICVANRNSRFTTADSPAVSLAAVTLGIHTAGGAQNTVLTVETGVTTGTTGYRSPVVDFSAYAGRDILIGLDWSSAGTIQQNYGTAYGGSGTGAAGTGTATKQTTLPLFVWIEFEVPDWVPTYAVHGDSLSIAVGSTNPLYDSPTCVLARRTGGVPMHWAHSGDSLQFWPKGSAKWDIYGKNIAPADSLIVADGSNDVFGGATLSELQSRFLSVVDIARQKISPNVYAATIAPRTSVTGAMEDVRRAYNTWLKSGAAPVRGVYNFSTAVSSDDETIIPAFDVDGTHYTTAGYVAQADLFTARPPVPANPVTAVDARVVAVEAVTPKPTVTDDGWLQIFAEDKAGRVALGIRPNGTVAGGGLPEITGYDIIVLGGQSDMSGAAKPYGVDVFPPHPRVLQFPATRWPESAQIMPAIEPLLGQGPLTSSAGGGPGLMFGRLWAQAHPDRVVLLVPAACTATGFNTSAKVTPDPGMAFSVGCWQINKTDEPVNLGQGMVDQAVAAKAAATAAAGVGKTVSVVAFLWSQGLSDGALSQAQYSTYFDELTAGLRTALAVADLPVVVGQMSPQGIANSISADKIDKAHMDTPRRLTRAAFAYSFGNLTNSPTDDHLSPRGQHKYAEAMFAGHERASLNVTGYSPIGVEDLTAKKVGTNVQVKWTAPASRVTGYTIDYSVDGGAFITTGVTQYYDMDTAATLPWSGSTIKVRVTANNEFGASSPVTTDI